VGECTLTDPPGVAHFETRLKPPLFTNHLISSESEVSLCKYVYTMADLSLGEHMVFHSLTFINICFNSEEAQRANLLFVMPWNKILCCTMEARLYYNIMNNDYSNRCVNHTK